MSGGSTQVILNVSGSNEQLTVSPERLIVAGYTAKDEAAVAEHIAELEAIGVPRPPSVPAFYDLDPALLTTDGVIAVDGPSTSGEVEPVLIRHGGRYFLGVGSDHTDRDLERSDIAASKAACPKPLGDTVVEIGAGMSTLDWDRLVAVSSVDGRTYQKGSVATLRHPADLLERMTAAVGEITGDLVLFCGTMPLLRSEFNYGCHWRTQLELPAGTVLAHAYETKQRSL